MKICTKKKHKRKHMGILSVISSEWWNYGLDFLLYAI